MTPVVVEAVGLSKRYLIGGPAGGSLREAVTWRVTRRERRIRPFWALRDVDLTVRQGESVGIIGRNGSGKSTLLRLLTRIAEPTEGFCRTRGRVGVLLEVGTGFHPELTGRENVFLNGAVLGMPRNAIRARLEEIVEFSGVSAFLDTPLKRYSTGMQLRLAFSVAAHLEPEVLIVDEVLAVGDAEFQARCLGRMTQLTGEGRTVLFVSHDLGAVSRLCSRAILLESGRVTHDGSSAEVVSSYVGDQPATFVDRASDPDDAGEAHVTGVRVLTHDSRLDDVRRDEPLVVEVDFTLRHLPPDFDLSIQLTNDRGIRLLDDAWSDHDHGGACPFTAGRNRARIELPPIFTAGSYTLGVWIGTKHDDFVYRDFLRFQLLPAHEESATQAIRERAVQPAITWHGESSR